MVGYSRACGSYHDFLDRRLLLARKLLNQEFLLVKLKWSLRKFYSSHHDLVDRYGIYVSQMTTDMFHLPHRLPGSFLIHLSSPPAFSGVRVTRSLALYVCFVDLCLSFFLLAMLLPVLLRYTDYDCPIGIFKLFLNVPVVSLIKGRVMHLGIRGIDFASFYDFEVWVWNCTDS